jgi:hypothetical protein
MKNALILLFMLCLPALASAQRVGDDLYGDFNAGKKNKNRTAYGIKMDSLNAHRNALQTIPRKDWTPRDHYIVGQLHRTKAINSTVLTFGGMLIGTALVFNPAEETTAVGSLVIIAGMVMGVKSIIHWHNRNAEHAAAFEKLALDSSNPGKLSYHRPQALPGMVHQPHSVNQFFTYSILLENKIILHKRNKTMEKLNSPGRE